MRTLETFHGLRLLVRPMIIAEKMQQSVHHQVLHMMLDRQPKLARPRAADVSSASTTSPRNRGSFSSIGIVGPAGNDSTLVGAGLPR